MTHIVAGNVAPNFSLNRSMARNSLSQTRSERARFFWPSLKLAARSANLRFPSSSASTNATNPESHHRRHSQNGPEKTAAFNKEYGVTFPVLLDEESKRYVVSNAYGLTMVPTLILADTNGSVLVSSMGFVKADIDPLLVSSPNAQKSPKLRFSFPPSRPRR